MAAISLQEAVALHRAGQFAAAEQAYRALLENAPNANVMQLLATLLHQDGRTAQGLPLLEAAMEHLGPSSGLLNNRSAMLLALGRPAEALTDAEQVLREEPGSAGASHNRLAALRALAGQEADLVARCERYASYLAAGGEDAAALLDYANCLRRSGRASTALPLFQRAAALAPDVGELGSSALIAASFDPEATTASLASLAGEVAVRYAAARHADLTPGAAWGFYSPRFGDGPMASLVLPVLQALSRRGIELVLVSGYTLPAVQSAPYRAVAHHWLDAQELDDTQLREALQRLGVGVMFDLCGHSPHNRLGAFSAGLAARQLLWGDWFGPVGVPGYDAYVGDAVANPPAEDGRFDETLLRLPRGRFTYRPPADAPEVIPPMEGAPRLVSYNRLAKLTEPTLASWAAILTRLPDAVLELRSDGFEQAGVRDLTADRFEALGIARERLSLRPFASYREVMEAYSGATLALDPFPFNGCVTTFDALVMEVPVIALYGATPVARQSASILRAAGLGDWVSTSESDYVERAVLLAGSPADTRSRLAGFRRHPILDIEAFTDDLVAAVSAIV